jgi:DNA repair exonuclease SbcCD ATPase subunit
MRLSLVLSLFAALSFLPWSALPARTPPPQGWEERNELRTSYGHLERLLERSRKDLQVLRDRLQEEEFWFLKKRQFTPDRVKTLEDERKKVDEFAREVEEQEQELARVQRRLGH